MRIVKCELKKIFKNRVIFIALAVFLLLNIINIYRNYNIHNGVDDCIVTGQLYLREQLDGELTEDKQALIYQQAEKLSGLLYNEKYANQTEPEKEFVTGYAFWDSQLWNTYRDYIDKAQSFNENIEQKSAEALKKAEYYSGKNEYYEAENKLYYNTYSGRKITGIYDTNGLSDYFRYSLSSVLSVIMLLLGVVPIFSSECECDMDTVLLTSKNGRRKTAFAKIISALIYTFAIELIFSICDFSSFICFARLDGLGQALYAVQGFEMCSADITVWQFCLILFAMRTIGMSVICLVFLLLSKLFRRSVASFVTGACLFFTLMLIKTFFTDTAGEIINLFNPISLLVSFNYFCDFTAVNLFGTPVFSYVFVGSVGVIIVLILSVVIFAMPLKMQLSFPKLTFRRSVRLWG